MALEEIAALIIRLTIGLLVVISAYVCSKDAASRQGAIADTALVFPWRTELFTFAGVMLMLLGGLSVLLGIFPRLGAIALTLFLIPAAMIHFRKASQSRRPEGRHPRRAGREVGHRAGIRHCARRFRHARQFHFGAEEPDSDGADPVHRAGRRRADIGFGPDGQLQGLLTRF